MSFLLQPWYILFAALCGLLNQHQQQIIEFQNAQIETLLKKLGRKRLLLDNNQRRLPAVKAHAIGHKPLLELTTIVTPDTILRGTANSWRRSSTSVKIANLVGHASARKSWMPSFASPERIHHGVTTESREHKRD